MVSCNEWVYNYDIYVTYLFAEGEDSPRQEQVQRRRPRPPPRRNFRGPPQYYGERYGGYRRGPPRGPPRDGPPMVMG